MHFYQIRPRKDHRGVDLISSVLPSGRLFYAEPNAVDQAIDYAKSYRRSHPAVIRVYDEAGNVIETHEHNGDFQRVVNAINLGVCWSKAVVKGEAMVSFCADAMTRIRRMVHLNCVPPLRRSEL